MGPLVDVHSYMTFFIHLEVIALAWPSERKLVAAHHEGDQRWCECRIIGCRNEKMPFVYAGINTRLQIFQLSGWLQETREGGRGKEETPEEGV